MGRRGRGVKRALLRRWMPATELQRQPGPLAGAWNEWTLFTADAPAPSSELLDLALEIVTATRAVAADGLGGRAPLEVDRWPGDHYRLLTGAADVVRPRVAVDIGTADGLSALALLRSPATGTVVTFDVEPWDASSWSGGSTALRAEDFGPRLRQVLGDLGRPETFAAHAELFADAELVFVDGPKDGHFEAAFFASLLATAPRHRQLVLVDDIHVLTMIELWRELPVDRLDLTSFGHFSGTGLLLR